MTEADWLTSFDPLPMLSFLRDRADPRKLRLLRIAAARLEWDNLPDYPYRRAVEAAEAHADGEITAEELAEHSSSLYKVFSPDAARDLRDGFAEIQARSRTLPGLKGDFTDSFILHSLAHAACQREKLTRVSNGGAMWGTAVRYLGPRLPPLIRDIFGNPFRPVVVDPSWLTPTVIELARAIYTDRSFNRMPELAGLLEGAGCADAGILTHCRAGEAHARGCWVVDSILGNHQ